MAYSLRTIAPSPSAAARTRRRLTVPLATLAVVVVVASACVPYWTPDSTLSVANSGPYVLVDWPAAIDEDPGQDVEQYEIDVDGATVATVAHPATECLLVGLTASTSYDVAVFAAGGGGSSRSIGENDTWLGSVTSSHLTGSSATTGSTIDCVDSGDWDGDRLPNGVETNTGQFLHTANTGTNPHDADSDGDGIGDGDETLGTMAGLDLPTMGTSPVHKDLLMEFDWFTDNIEPSVCGSHSHRPTSSAIARVSDAFGNAPVTNLDGTTGVNLIADIGQGGVFTGGNHVPDADGVIAGGVGSGDYIGIRSANFADNRQGYFHYTLLPHRFNTNSDSSGQAEVRGDDTIVSLYCYGSTGNVANTIMHEVGHNLGLWHGGDETTNYMWNYNSVMNYLYQFPGVDNDCVLGGDDVLDYSSGQRGALNENALVEANGICGGVGIDWNGNSSLDHGTVTADINGDSHLSTLSDHDDWSNLYFTGAAAGAGAGAGPSRSSSSTTTITEQPVPLSAQD